MATFFSPLASSYIGFLSVIQISVGINLLTSIYFADINLNLYWLLTGTGLLLSTSGFFSFMVGIEVNHIAKEIERLSGTTLESKIDEYVSKELKKIVNVFFLGEMERRDRISSLILIDFSFFVLGLLILVMSK